MGNHIVKVWLSTHRYSQKVLISVVVGLGPKTETHAVQLVSASVIWYNLAGEERMSPSEAGDSLPCVWPAYREKRDRAVLAGPIPTRNAQSLFVLLGVLKPPQCYTITLPNSLLCKRCYVLIWGGNKLPPGLGFCFKPLALMCLAEMSCIHALAQRPWVGFYWLTPSWQRFACHSWG